MLWNTPKFVLNGKRKLIEKNYLFPTDLGPFLKDLVDQPGKKTPLNCMIDMIFGKRYILLIINYYYIRFISDLLYWDQEVFKGFPGFTDV